MGDDMDRLQDSDKVENENEQSGAVNTEENQDVVSRAESVPNEPLVQPVEPPAEVDAKKPRKKHVVFGIIIATLIILGVAFFIWKDQIIGLFVKQSAASQTTQASNSTSVSDQEKITDPALQKFITPTTGEVWYKTPKEMDNLGLLNNDYRDTFVDSSLTKAQIDEQYANMKPTYYEVGTHGDKTIIMARCPGEVGNDYALFFEKKSDGTFTLVSKPSSTATYDGYYDVKGDLKTGKATVDETTHYDSLSLPDTVKLKDTETITSLKSPSFLFTSRAEGTTETSVMELGSATVVRTEKAYADTKLTNIGYTVKLSFGPEIQVDYVPNTRSLEKYTFDNGKAATYKDYDGKTVYDEISAIAKGCGGTSAAVTRSDSLQDGDLVAVGKTDTGRVVYGLKDTTSALMTKAYTEYKEAFPDNPVSLSDYVANHGLLVIKNTAGERLVYVRGQYGMSGGCAKPVVYLYPTTAEQVSVKVGATVTVSDPLYTADGWKNVWAEPNGMLTYNGKQYDSLFWEGKGYGDYPGITSGTVVKRTDAAATIKRQLAEQGLNTKETTDFMAYWQDKIPNKPYVRLTWLNTAQMNTLAPLSISPKPDTVIRVFLDMEGFDTLVQLPVQNLTSTFRHGFTVVEWGGLTSEIRR